MEKLKKEEGADLTDIGVKAASYVGKKKQEKLIQGEIKDLKGALEKYLGNNYKEDTKGHHIATVSHLGMTIDLIHQKRVSSVCVPNAIAILKKNVPKEVFNRCVETVEILREDVIEVLHSTGVIDSTLLAKLYEPKESYSFLVKEKTKLSDEDI